MAKKDEKTLSYLQVPLPEGRKSYRTTKREWYGLNLKQTIDTGALSVEHNISTIEAPYLVPSQKRSEFLSGYFAEETDDSAAIHPIGAYGFDDFLLVIYEQSGDVWVDYIKDSEEDGMRYHYKGIVGTYNDVAPDLGPRCVVQFNVYDTPTDPVSGQYIKKLLFFPDKASMYMHIVDTDTDPTEWDDDQIHSADMSVMYCYNNGSYQTYYTVKTVKVVDEGDEDEVTYEREVEQCGEEGYFRCSGMDVLVKEYYNRDKEKDGTYPPPETANHNYYYRNTYNQEVYRWVIDDSDSEKSGWKVSIPPAMPNIKYAAVHLSRLFGVDESRVYASGFNDYTNWNLDTIEDANESNAWCSPAQSNTKAGGAFTGITNFQGHIVCFKRDYMHEIYNTKNPFRIQDIYAEGAVDNRTIQDVDSKLIFVSDDNVKVYTGSNPRIISTTLNLKKYSNAVAGTDGRCYYLYCEDTDKKKRLLVYDTYVDQWSEQSINKTVLNFAYTKNGMFMLCDDGVVYKMNTGDYSHFWMFETDLITGGTANIKHLKKIQLLAEFAEDSRLAVYVLYGNEKHSGASHQVHDTLLTGVKETPGLRVLRIRPRSSKNADYGIRLHVEGMGYIKFHALELFMEAGGDSYVGT